MNTYKCPNCGTELKQKSKFCINCGSNLEEDNLENPTCPKCGKTYISGAKFCSDDGSILILPEKLVPCCIKCGEKYNDGSKYCPNDGGKVILPEDNNNSANVNKNNTHKSAKDINSWEYSTDEIKDINRQQIIINQIPQQRSNGAGTAGFVIALISLLFCWVPGVGFVLWFIGLLLSFIGLFKSPRGLAITGFIISLIDLFILIVFVGALASIFL